ncbi:MAG: hypothetical protein J7518_02440 [Nocardioidaceae bacterium]|nr:hypothetical protein [Nocardioidaceae bacterium]
MRSRFILGIQQLLGREQADPRVAQYAFWVPVFIDIGFLLLGPDKVDSLSRDYLTGLVVIVAATVLGFAISRDGLPPAWTVAIPVLDILATGFMRQMPESTGDRILVFPAIWLGLQFGRRGIVLSMLSVLASFGIAVGSNRDLLEWDVMAQQLVLSTLCATVVALTAEAWQGKVAEAAEAQRMLERAVADSAEQRRFNEAILNSVDVGLLVLDAHGRVHSANPRHERLMDLAYPEGHEGLPERSGHVYGPDGFTQLTREELPTWRTLHGEPLRDYLIWVGSDPRIRRAFAVSSSTILTPAGDFDGAVLAYHDVTELMTAARLKDEFVATVSHELRTPLTSIVGYVDILLEDLEDLPAEATPFLETVQRNARRLHRLVDDLLSDALKLGRAELHLDRVSLALLVRASAVEAEKSARTAGLLLETQIDGDPLEVSGDSERLAQVFDNLFNNAIKFTPSGGKVAGEVKREGNEAVVRISDTGRGIPPEEVEDVFVKFFRSPGVQLDAIPGTGIGLAISKTIVEAHGGSIGLTSEVGVGTTLEVRLPLVGPRVARAG